MNDDRFRQTLQATALVHEAYIRLVNWENVSWQNRAGGGQKILLDDAVSFSKNKELDLVRLDEALETLEKLDKRQARIVELRFFGGLSTGGNRVYFEDFRNDRQTRMDLWQSVVSERITILNEKIFQKIKDIFGAVCDAPPAQRDELMAQADAKNTLARRDLAQSLKSVGETFLKFGEREKAKQNYEKAFGILQDLINRNALGDYDRKMLDDVQKALQKL